MGTAREHGRLFIGTSGWNYKHWRIPFYQGLPAAEFLSFYARRFKAVEVNKSFYRLLTRAETRRWARQTPDDFLFVLKGSRFITHMLKLKKPRPALRHFFAPLSPLQKKMGPVLFQLPPNWNKDIDRLKDFLTALPSGHRVAFEFRDPRWISDDVLELLRAHGAAFCLYDFDGHASARHVTADFTYVRLHGPGAKYQGLYTAAQLDDWADWIKRQTRAGTDAYCFFDNDQNAFAVRNATELCLRLGVYRRELQRVQRGGAKRRVVEDNPRRGFRRVQVRAQRS
jgi:uncharacterized protein YecE (DUF72 family)